MHDEAQEVIASLSENLKRRPLTINRAINLLLMLLYATVLVVHVVCLAVLAAKRNEIVGKFKDDEFYQSYNIKESCMLFVDYDGRDENGIPQIKWVNNKCHLVIYGSAALGGCALMMIIYLMIRTVLFRRLAGHKEYRPCGSVSVAIYSQAMHIQ